MYLLVFVFILMSVIGVYVQVFSLQTTRMFADQSAMAGAMLAWHNAAYKTAKENMAAIFAGTLPCQMATGRAPACAVQISSTHLPSGYNTSYNFSSVAYSSGSQKFLLTFVSPPSGNSQVPVDSLAINPAIGFSVSEIYQQIEKLASPGIGYGRVVSGQFVSKDVVYDQTNSAYTAMNFAIPSGGVTVIDGSVGYISIM